MKKQMILLIVALAVSLMAGLVNAQVAEPPLSYTGSIEENFDSIGFDGTAMPVGWIAGGCPSDAGEEADPPGEYYNDEALDVDDGSNDSRGNTYNYGTTGDPDRAVGQMPTSGSNDRGIQVALRNDTGSPITVIEIRYTGEQWKDNESSNDPPYQPDPDGNPDPSERLVMYISHDFDFSGIVERLPIGFDFVAPQDNGGNVTLDGNLPANRTENIGGEYTFTTPIPVDGIFYISWHDWENNGTADHALAIDDVVIGTPGTAQLVSPIDWAYRDVALLEWLRPLPTVPGDPDVTVNVRFGTDPNLIVGVNGTLQIETDYDGDSTTDIPGLLDDGETYYWIVDVIDPNGGNGGRMIPGARWEFITTVPAEVMLSKTALTVSEEGATSDTYRVTLSKAPAQPVTVTVTPPNISVDVGSTAQSDNSEETISSGGIDALSSSDLELGWEGSSTDRKLVGLRFNNIDIPNGATISNAYMRFNEDEATSGVCNLIIVGELSPDALTFTTTNSDISNRPRTTATVAWTDVPAWSGDNNYNTSDISSIISEIVGQGGWVAGNSLVLMIEPDTSCPDKRVAESSEHADKYPRLHVEYVMTTGFPVTWTSSVVLDGTNWSTGEDITVTAIDDSISETDPHMFTLSHLVSSTDTQWNVVIPDDVVVTIVENDCGAWGFHPLDLNEDCVIDIIDLAMLASEFGICTDPHFPGACDDVR